MGLFGMNVDFPFITNVTAFWCIVGVMALITGFLIFYFFHRTNQ